MDAKSPLSQKISPGRALLIVAILAIPAFFWFRYLYMQFVVLPDQISPEMAKMRDMTLQKNLSYSASGPTAKSGKPAPKATADAHKLPGKEGEKPKGEEKKGEEKKTAP